MKDDGYEGPAEIISGSTSLSVSVRLAGHFGATRIGHVEGSIPPLSGRVGD